MGPKQVSGSLIAASILAFPSPDNRTGSVVATTVPPEPPQTRLALTLVTGPGFPSFGRIKSRTSTRRRPSSFRAAEPRWTVQGAPPLGTPPITVFGFEPIIVERNKNPSAIALSTKTPASRPPKRTALAKTLVII